LWGVEVGVQLMEDIARWIEWIGVAILVVSLVLSLGRAMAAFLKKATPSQIYVGTRSFLGRGILLGLEVLIAADLIRTVAVAPTLDNAVSLGVIVLIRTFLSFSLDVEITGKLPWRQGGSGDGAGKGASPARDAPGPESGS
jgi:uncharacterized membrane protein